MQFHLNYNPKVSYQKITHSDPLLMIGSCFSEHIGNRLNDLKFNISSNPFGIVFNPESIRTLLLRIIEKKYFTANDAFEKDGQWFCLEAHSLISASSKEALIKELNFIIDDWNTRLQTADLLMITFGSAFAYKHKEQQQIVANCHKLSQTLFEKILMEPQELVRDYKNLIDKLQQFNPSLKLLFTVSPVKHLRDGVEENSLGKAILIQTVHQLLKHGSQCFYFPAYELVNDDLRDYRFYKEDMAHPNEQAIDYVWQKFTDVYFNEDTLDLCDKLKQVNLAMKHHFFNEAGEPAINFKKKFYEKCVQLQAHYPFINLSAELHYFKH